MRVLAACLLAVSLLPACASRDNYITNRIADFSDILRASVMAGAGVAVKVDATRLIQVGGAYTQDVYAAGWANRSLDTWRESVRSWGLIVGYHKEEVTKIGYYSGSYGWAFGDGGMTFQPGKEGHYDLDLITFRLQAMFLIGVDIEVRVGEVLDFIAGIFQFDPAGDDRDYEAMKEPKQEDEAAPGSES